VKSRDAEGAARKDFFSEEKKQKTFVHGRIRSPGPTRQSAKVFWFFFSKKNDFPFTARG
jgi:hypothetical protein